MAYNNNTPRAEYTASAAQTVFPFLFKIFTSADIKVYQTPAGQAPDDVADLLTLTTDYTVSINGDAGGEIILVSGATNGDKLTLLRSLEITRDIEYQAQGDLTAATLNLDQEYQTYLIADREAISERFIKLSENAQGVNGILPAPVGDAYFKWSADALSIENDTTIPDAVITSAVNAAAAAASATQAQLFEWEAEAERLTADSYATEAEDVFVNLVTSDGDGTFTYTPTADYSALHWSAKAATFNPADFIVIENNETIVHDITVDADYTLTALQNKYGRIEITDTGVILTTGRNIVVDNIQKRFIFVNSTAQILTVKTAAGTGIAVAVGATVDLYNDGTDVISAVDDAIYNPTPVIATGSATFTNATNNIALTGIGIGVEVGDVIAVTGSVSNNKEFTIEVITDDNNVIVNQAHAGGATSKSLVNETASVTVTLLSKWYSAAIGIGQGWVSVLASRSAGVTYTNTTGRAIQVHVNCSMNTGASLGITIGGVLLDSDDVNDSGDGSGFDVIVPKGATYIINPVGGTIASTDSWVELR